MLEPQIRTPFGGMNQDDSLITPSKDSAGKNAFEIGDYRYALNARIGSSRSDNFGDLENIRDTVEVTTYYAAALVFENTSFDGNLDNWDQLDESPTNIVWAYNDNAARLTLTPGLAPAAAPLFIDKSTAASGNGATINQNYMGTILAGDLLVVVGLSYQESGGVIGDVVVDTPGWSEAGGQSFRNSTPINVGTFKAYTKIAVGGETGSITLSRTGSTGGSTIFYTQMYRFRGTNLQVEDFDWNILGDGNATVTYNAVTVGGAERTLIALCGQIGAQPSTASGYTNKATDESGGVVVDLRCDVKEDVASDGSVTASGGNNAGWATIHISIFGNDYTPTAFTSEVIYQTTTAPIGGQEIDIQFGLALAGGTITSGDVSIVYMNGSSIVSEESVASGTLSSMTFNEKRTLAANVNGLGIRVMGTIALPATVDLQYYQALGTFLAPSTRPTGTEKVIGKLEDYEFQRLYYCVWNSEGHHCIRYWDALNNYIVEVLQWEGLNWESDYFVKMAKLDNWMAFTDRHNPPRLIDVDAVAALKAVLGDEFREFHISFHKWAPTVPPIPRVYYDGSTNNYDKLKDKVYHFSYRYIYRGNLKSCWSPISKGATVINMSNTFYANRTITAIEIDIPGSLLNEPPPVGPPSHVEFPYFDHTDVKFTSVVDYIELAFQDGELELWKLWKRVPVTPAFNRLQYFNGDGLLTPVNTDDFIQPFDMVPFLAGTVEAIDNRFVFGDCLDEKPPVTNWTVEDISSVYGLDEWQDPRTTSFAAISAVPRAKLQRLNALSNLTFKDRTYYKMGIQFLYPAGWRTGVYTSEEWLYNVPDVGGQLSGTDNIALNFSIPDNMVPPEGAIGYQIMRTNALSLSFFMFGIVNQLSPLVDDVSTVIDSIDLPDTVKTRINDHFQNVNTIASKEVIEYTQKVLEEEIAANAKKDRRIKRKNRILRIGTIANIGVGSASHNLTAMAIEKWGRRTPIGPVLEQQLRKTKALLASVVANASRIHIDINNWIFGAKSGTDTEFPLNKLFYTFTPGDRVRFVGSTDATPTDEQLQEFDVPIIEYTGKGLIIERPEDCLWISDPEDADPRNFNIEVYSPHIANQQDHIFYEMGEWYPVLYPLEAAGLRDFAKRDFVWVNEAAVTLSQYGPFDFFNKMPLFYGDCYNVGKTVYRDDVAPGWVGPNSSPMFISMNPDVNKTFDYWDKNNGRPAIAYDELPVERFKPTIARFSGKIVEESFINNINNMREEDQFVYPSEYGRIRDMVNTSNAQVESVGAILLVIGERETWSVYVNRTTLEDLSGRSQVSLSDDVLGSFNTLLGSHGTLNPESVSKNRGNVWYWDAIDGSWIRYGRDGLTEISSYKMRNWFSELGDLMITKYQTDEIPLALAEYDKFNDELVTYQNHSTLPATFRGYENYKGTLFSENDTRWKSCHNFTPEMMGKMNKQLIMFKAGAPYLYEKAATHSTFFGVKYDVMWEPVCNDNPQFKKAWSAFGVTATNRWSVERILSEYRGLKAKQETSIAITTFEEREDNYYVAIPRDENTPNIGSPRINGNQMKSKAIQVLMKLDPAVTYLSLLHYVSAQLSDSPKNP